MRAYEIHTMREGVWKVDSIFDTRELAIFEAKKIDEGTRYAGVKVVEEIYHEASNLTTTRTLFRGGAAKAKKTPKPAGPATPQRAGQRTGTGKEPVHKRRARPEVKKINALVPILVLLLLFFCGLTVYLALQYFSFLK